MVYREGTHRTISNKDKLRDSKAQWLDLEDTLTDRTKLRIVEAVGVIDKAQKRLTGRRAEQYARESSISQNELFPKDAAVLNIGDPWQALDLPGVTTVEYETGEEAVFVHDNQQMLDSIQTFVGTLNNFCDYKTTYDKIAVNIIQTALIAAKKYLENPTLEHYPAVGAIFRTAMEEFQEHQASLETLDTADQYHYGHTWYALMRLASGFEDVYLFKKVIEPELNDEVLRRKRATDAERKVLLQQAITKYRFQLRYKNAKFVKATFPDVPLETNQFDRIVASWSISTHMFPNLAEVEFDAYWQEINRLLKRDGVAYIWPIYHGNDQTMLRSLQKYGKRAGDVAIIVRKDGYDSPVDVIYWIDDSEFETHLPQATTLVIFSKGVAESSKERFVSSVQFESQREVA